ncbi:hypothetical protein [Bailinhaonella thermotolerans]|uniref:hypothetical protein n=1 Tax=Bailinhaonella thermotolerans TaxID=1070861 RepID=UPI00192A3419|nr:hypothetical protein [Bailinhaonella thermotolerans]
MIRLVERLSDRLLSTFVPEVTVSAGCSRYTVCRSGTLWCHMCCKDEGCQNPWVCGSC